MPYNPYRYRPPSTPEQLARRRERDRARRAEKKLDSEAVLAKHGLHWFSVGKTTSLPCQKCGLRLSNKIHRDSNHV